MPHPSFALASAHLAVAERIRRELPTTTSSEEIAQWAGRCGALLSQVGRPGDAPLHAEEALALYRELAAEMPDRFRPGPAMALSNVGVAFSELGRATDALPPTEEAVAIRRELTTTLPGRRRPGLARSLSNLSNVFSALSRADEAAATRH